MASIPVVSVGAGRAVLALTVDDATRMVTGWTVTRSADIGPVEVSLSAGAYSARQTVGVGNTSGSVPKNRQWNFDTTSVNVAYELTAR